MAEAPNNNGLQLKTAFGEVAAKGSQVVSAVLLAILVGVALWEHRLRSEEHVRIVQELDVNRQAIINAMEQGACLNKLAVYQQLKPRGEIDWASMPTELYPCIPRFMLDKQQK